MKKILILSCLFLFFVSSCSNQEEVIVGDGLDYDNMSEEDLRKCAEANGAITWNQFIELMGEFMESEQSPLIETKATSETFSVTGKGIKKEGIEKCPLFYFGIARIIQRFQLPELLQREPLRLLPQLA